MTAVTQLSVNTDERKQPLILPRLLDKVASAALNAFDGEVDIAPRRHHNHGKARIEILNAGQQIKPFPARRGIACVIEIDQNDIVVALAQRLNQQLR